MYVLATDKQIFSTEITSAPADVFELVSVAASNGLVPIKHFLEGLSWSSAKTCACCVKDEIGFGTDGGNFLYDDDLEPEDELFEGVVVNDPFDGVIMSRRAFDSLMVRFFRTLISVANDRYLPVRSEAWWPEFTDNIAAIGARSGKSL